MKEKLTSRKFWTAVSGIITGLLLIFGFSEDTLSVVAGFVLVLGDTIAYMITEGRIDERREENAKENE